MKCLAVAAVALAALAAAPPAAAKSCFRVSAPAIVAVGKTVTIRVDALEPTYADDGDLIAAEPVEDRTVAMSVHLLAPSGPRMLLSLRRVSSTPSRWVGRFTFRKSGAWRIRWTGGANRCAPEIGVLVRRRSSRCVPTHVRDDRVVGLPGPLSAVVGWTQVLRGRFRIFTDGFNRKGHHNEKVLWVVPDRVRALVDATLTITARSGGRTIVQRFNQASSPQSQDVFFPSILRLPTPGCWTLTLRTGRVVAELGVLVR